MGCIYKRGKKYWVKYYQHGKQYAESSHSSKKAVAERLLRLREGEIAQGKLPSFYFDRIIFDELIKDFLTDYRINCNRSLNRAEGCTRKLLEEFAGTMVPDITTARIKQYVAKRQAEGVSNATINRELSAIKRAFNLAARSTPPKVAQVPYIPMLVENNVRKGFIEHEDYTKLLSVLPDYLKPVFTFAYLTGWRKSEVLDLKWNHVNLIDGIVRIEPGVTKNKEGRTLYMEPELWDMMNTLHKKRRHVCPYVFDNNGHRIGSFRKTWKNACKSIGKPELLFHDLRRSGVRNMVRAGISERVVMTISGHKTRSVFDRYDIVSERDMLEAAQKRHEFSERQSERLQFSYNQHQKAQKVTALVP